CRGNEGPSNGYFAPPYHKPDRTATPIGKSAGRRQPLSHRPPRARHRPPAFLAHPGPFDAAAPSGPKGICLTPPPARDTMTPVVNQPAGPCPPGANGPTLIGHDGGRGPLSSRAAVR